MESFLSHLSTSDIIAIVTASIALLGIVIGSVIPYYLAHRQGIFRKSKLLAQFGNEESPDPSILMLEIPAVPCRENVALIPFVVKNIGAAPLTNVSLQFNIMPAKNLAAVQHRIGQAFPDVEIATIGNRDILEFRFPSMAPGEGTAVMLPFLIDGPALPLDGEKFSEISVFFTHDQGRRQVEKRVDIVAVTDPRAMEKLAANDEATRRRFHDIVHRLSFRGTHTKVPLNAAIASMLLNIPFMEKHWVLSQVRLKRVAPELAMDALLVDHSEPPPIYIAWTGFGFSEKVRRTLIWRVFVPVFVVACSFIAVRAAL